jgi:flagellar biosynthesis regulator FlaF
MQTSLRAATAYRASAAHRSDRQREADIFLQVISTLRTARTAGPVPRVRALADNRRLWMTVMDVVRDPLNRLPDGTKSGLISIGLAVEREMDRDSPNFDFLIEVNQHIVAGLTADG